MTYDYTSCGNLSFFNFSISLIGYMFEGENKQAYIIQETLKRIIDKLFIIVNEIFENSFDCYFFYWKTTRKTKLVLSTSFRYKRKTKRRHFFKTALGKMLKKNLEVWWVDLKFCLIHVAFCSNKSRNSHEFYRVAGLKIFINSTGKYLW